MIRRLLTLVIIFLLTNRTEGGLVFNLIDTGGAGTGTSARAGFQAAADFWSSAFTDDVIINLNIGFTGLGSGILGSASSTQGLVTYSDFRNAVNADITSANDATFAATLPTGSSFDPYINRTADNPNGSGSAIAYVDNDGGNNNTQVRMNTATAKALGLLAGNSSLIDAAITFSSNFAFDFDRSDGIDSGQYDFVGVAIHEIGHALGFVSGVDILDINSPGTGGPFNDDLFTYVSPLDFTRFSIDSETAGADFDWTADVRSKYFSIDGGATSLVDNAWSLGTTHGDGRQASHWKDNRGLGILDPTFSNGELGIPTELDLIALDVIGFDRLQSAAVPEPSSLLMISTVAIGWALQKRRRTIDPEKA